MIQKQQKTQKQDNFIMLPTVDFCFKELMQNSFLYGENVYGTVK